MKLQTMLFWAVVAGAGYLLLKKPKAATSGATGRSLNPDHSPVVHVVEETLHKHEGEDNPIVHAFEEALEQKQHGSAA